MRFYSKKAEDLQPGDYLANGAMVVFVKLQDFVMADLALSADYAVTVNSVHRKDLFDLRAEDAPAPAPALTSAQQHAEELAKYARIMFDFIESPATAFYNEYRNAIIALLASVEPPEPPTLEEALAALAAAVGGSDSNPEHPDIARGIAILDRARRAGLLK